MRKCGKIGRNWGPLFAVCGAILSAGSAHAQAPVACDDIDCDGVVPGAIGGAVGAPLISMRPLTTSEPFADLFGDSPFLYGDASIWIEHMEGVAPGWEPYTGIGGTAPLPMGSGVLMFQGRALVTNEGNASGTIGVHRRIIVGRSLLGAGVWYDATQSPYENTFHQTSVSLEWFPMSHWSIRGNGYFPMGTKTEHIDTVAVMADPTIQFRKNVLVSSTTIANRFDDAALRGYEIEFARNLGTWSGEAFAGYYHYEGDVGGRTDGVKAGIRGYITPRLAGRFMVTDDPDFGTNLSGGITWFFGGGGGKAPRSLHDKLTLPVERNPMVVINRTRTALIDRKILTDGGQTITVTHVNSRRGGANLGTFENPFRVLPPTQSTDIVYVHADSTFDGQTYVMHANQSLLGEGDGNVHMINTDQYGMIPLPAGSGGTSRPVIQKPPTGIVLAHNATISNLHIVDGPQFGVYANGVGGNVAIDRLMIEGGDVGVGIFESSGVFTMTDVTISDSAVAGLGVGDGSATINFGSNSSIDQGGDGLALHVIDGHTGAITFAADSTIHATSGLGLGFNNADGNYNFAGDVTLNGGDAGIGIIEDSNGTFTFGPATSLTNMSVARAFVVNDLGAGAQIDFNGSITGEAGSGDLVYIDTTAATSTINFNATGSNSIAANGAGGIVILEADGDVTFTTPVTIENPETAQFNDGIRVAGGSGNISFSDTHITLPEGGFSAAVNVQQQAGSVAFNDLVIEANSAGTVAFFAALVNHVTVSGTSAISSDGGSAVGITTANNINITFDEITAENTADNITGGSGVSLVNIDAGTFHVAGRTRVHNTDGSLGHGIRIDGATGDFTFADVDIDATIGDGVAIGTTAMNPGTVTIHGGSITNTNGDGVRVLNTGMFNLNNTTFVNNAGDTIELMNSTVSGSGNTAVPFNPNDGGGNAGMILFNGGADTIP